MRQPVADCSVVALKPGARTFWSELGGDLSAFPTVKHFTSWLGLCPDNRISDGKILGIARSIDKERRLSDAIQPEGPTVAKFPVNAFVHRIIGRFGDMVVRKRNGQMFISRAPDPSTTPPSAGQADVRNLH